jgi:hypothetical protein
MSIRHRRGQSMPIKLGFIVIELTNQAIASNTVASIAETCQTPA